MAFFNKTISDYAKVVQPGLVLLAGITLVRFLLQPVFNVPIEAAGKFASITIFSLIVGLFYVVKAAVAGDTYRDLLGLSITLFIGVALLISVAIGVDEFAGIDTYFTHPSHGGDTNPFIHMFAHLVFGAICALLVWGIGSLVRKMAKAPTS